MASSINDGLKFKVHLLDGHPLLNWGEAEQWYNTAADDDYETTKVALIIMIYC